ncbi:8950_t:CDS:2 [Ambispora leptoticha]|uniref:8950_t:CDS:1 n=1 Tax=Ambispora leptoticha TaxID=144679 RepID=A0A9N9F753_9GLOM|nr:8950_t:CDS:2 [Ambispora leptoticha]
MSSLSKSTNALYNNTNSNSPTSNSHVGNNHNLHKSLYESPRSSHSHSSSGSSRQASTGSSYSLISSSEKMNNRLTPKAVSIALAVLSPACFLATAALQQLQVVESTVLPSLYNFFLRKDIPFVMIGVMFFWVYVLTASLSVVAQAAGLRNGYDNNEPRYHKLSIRGAFGRMIAAHQVALETVPGMVS